MAIRAGSAGVLEGAPPATRDEPTIVEVDLGDRSYPIYIGAGLLNQPELLQRHVKGKKV
jgi:3-dehydroquinate synthase